MKKCFASVLLLLLCVATFAQKVGYDYITLKFKLPPTHPMTAGSTYRTVIHYQLHYNNADFGGENQIHLCDGTPMIGTNHVCKSIKTPQVPLDATYLNTDQADYTFELTMPGLTPVDTTFRKSNDIGNKLGNMDFSMLNNDYVMVWGYSMPATLVAKDKQGKVIGSIPLVSATKKFTAVVHKYYFINAANKDFGNQGLPEDMKTDPKVGYEVGFEKPKQYTDFMSDLSTQVLKREEAIIANEVFDTVEKILRNDYGTIAFTSQIAMGKVKAKKGDNTFADLDTALSYVSSGAEDMRKGTGTYDDFLKKLAAARTIYQDAIAKDNGRLTDDIKNMLYNNLAYIDIFLGNIEQGDKYMAMHHEGMMGAHHSGYDYHRDMLVFRKKAPTLL